jgi:hypothetical protein
MEEGSYQMLTIGQQADLRQACLEFLASRYPCAYTADAIGRMLTRRQRIDYAVIASDITAACSFLKDECLAASIMDALSIAPSWQATSNGVARYQRRRVEEDPSEGRV